MYTADDGKVSFDLLDSSCEEDGEEDPSSKVCRVMNELLEALDVLEFVAKRL